jgi:hypothetical protein
MFVLRKKLVQFIGNYFQKTSKLIFSENFLKIFIPKNGLLGIQKCRRAGFKKTGRETGGENRDCACNK